MRDICGVIVVNKPRGISSYGVVERIKKATKAKKVGHAGALDPAADGVLVILLGRATKLFETISSYTKEYRGAIALGKMTDTLDVEGKLTKVCPIPDLTEDEIKKRAQDFVGWIKQVPPRFSALSVGGKRAYKLARKGEEFALAPRDVHIESFEITRISLPQIDFKVVSSKGMYVRSLARDFAYSLGSCGYLLRLTRTRVGQFSLDKSYEIDDILRFSREDNLNRVIIPVEEVLESKR
ncbi:MAG: tRNA pseudouridine(55) synthase TruB [candidate division Zixibacteria bacterium 4484_93]|nr:MAG: tRNA pseudouridine(55) synthase TruB [candidate division Zixibacteria bacterium 4484_93]